MKTGVETESGHQLVTAEEEEVRRIDRKYLSDSILSAFYLEKGLLFTIKMLFLKPGLAINDFLFTHHRKQYTKPLGFLILSSSIAAIIAFSFSDSQQIFMEGFNEGYGTSEIVTEDNNAAGTNKPAENSDKVARRAKVAEQMQMITNYYAQNFNLFLIIFVPFCAVFCHLFFRKDRWYFPEHLVSNAYMVSMQNVISIPFFLLAFYSVYVSYAYLVVVAFYQAFLYNRVYSSARGFKGILRIMGVMVFSSVAYTFFLIIILTAVLLTAMV